MTNSINNNGKNSRNVVLTKFKGEIAKKILAELQANHSLRFSIIKDEDEEDGKHPVVELIKDV